MPRKSKPQSTTVVSPGQPYGIAGEQQAAMATIPLPNNETQLPPLRAASPMQENINPAMGGSNPPFADVLNAAVAAPVPGQGAFSAPSIRPNQDMLENVAPAPQVQQTNPTIELLKIMASNMGNDPAILEIVNRLQTQGA